MSSQLPSMMAASRATTVDGINYLYDTKTETATVEMYDIVNRRDENGNLVKDENGKNIKDSIFYEGNIVIPPSIEVSGAVGDAAINKSCEVTLVEELVTNVWVDSKRVCCTGEFVIIYLYCIRVYMSIAESKSYRPILIKVITYFWRE